MFKSLTPENLFGKKKKKNNYRYIQETYMYCDIRYET